MTFYDIAEQRYINYHNSVREENRRLSTYQGSPDLSITDQNNEERERARRGESSYTVEDFNPDIFHPSSAQKVAVRQSPPIVAMVPSGPWRGGHIGTWLPDGEARGVLLLHHGHSAFDGGTYAPGNLIPVAEAFAAAGFLVYGLEMPPGEHEGIPIEEFLEASKEVLDTVEADDPHTPVYMVGLSGGGWTTTVLTATDARITRGYSVAGDHPVESVERGDWEQHIMDYPLLYAMAGDRLRHIYVWGDGCCFGHVTGDIGTPYVIDTSTQDHTISPWAVQWILEDITQLSTIE
jgi:hypothetical protein